VGFDPDARPPDRLGIRRSIEERMADVGGSADVRSAPGCGTTVELHWSPRPVPEPALTADADTLERVYARNGARAVAVGALLWQAGLGMWLLGHLTAYRQPLVVLGAWAISLVLMAHCVTVAPGERFHPAVVTVMTMAVAAIQIIVGLSVQARELAGFRPAMFADIGVVILLVFGRPAGRWLLPVTLLTGTAAGMISWRYGDDPAMLARFGGLLYAQAAFQVALSILWRARQTVAVATAHAACAQANLIADRATAVAVHHDRQLRLLELADDPLFLLTELGAGTLDPRDDAVRARCAQSASVLRRTLTRQPSSSELIIALERAARSLERRGSRVELQVAGEANDIPAVVRQEIVAAATARLTRVAGGRVLLTLTAGTRDGSLLLAFPVAGTDPVVPELPAHAAMVNRWIDVVEDNDDSEVYVEIRWGPAVPTGTSW
jgi:hypothetical protein